MSTDPGFGTAFTVTDLNAAIEFKFPVAPVLLVQSSRNIRSAGLGGPLDVAIPGVYDFRVTVLDGDTALGRPGVGTDDAQPLGQRALAAPAPAPRGRRHTWCGRCWSPTRSPASRPRIDKRSDTCQGIGVRTGRSDNARLARRHNQCLAPTEVRLSRNPCWESCITCTNWPHHRPFRSFAPYT